MKETREIVMAGLTVEDMDRFETHDCFTSSENIATSAFGLTEPGREYEAVESGKIGFYGNKRSPYAAGYRKTGKRKCRELSG